MLYNSVRGINCLLLRVTGQRFLSGTFASTVNPWHLSNVHIVICLLLLPILLQGPSLQLDLDGQITSTS